MTYTQKIITYTQTTIKMEIEKRRKTRDKLDKVVRVMIFVWNVPLISALFVQCKPYRYAAIGLSTAMFVFVVVSFIVLGVMNSKINKLLDESIRTSQTIEACDK